jgi:hypothetical protein
MWLLECSSLPRVLRSSLYHRLVRIQRMRPKRMSPKRMRPKRMRPKRMRPKRMRSKRIFPVPRLVCVYRSIIHGI